MGYSLRDAKMNETVLPLQSQVLRGTCFGPEVPTETILLLGLFRE